MASAWEPRKYPQQERSRIMCQKILDASVRILSREGALGFTTTKVAEEAGISVGSLYQYFPNKQALIAALHDEDMNQGWLAANQILEHPTWSPRRKLIEVTRWFFESEADEAQTLGAAAGAIDIFLRDTGARIRNGDLIESANRRAAEFIAASSETRRTKLELDYAGDFLVSTVEASAKAIAARSLTSKQRRRWANDTATMLADHLGIVD